MKLSYKTKKLEKSFATDRGLAKNYGTLAKKVKQRKQQLENADKYYLHRVDKGSALTKTDAL